MSKQSFLNLQAVSGALLRERTRTVQTFLEQDDQYEALIRDDATGEYFLHHAHLHLNVADGGSEEQYHAIMPLSHDEVIAMTTQDLRYVFPDDWHKPFLRNGPEEQFIWFDPEMMRIAGSDEQFGAQLREMMLAFKQAGQFDQESMAGLFAGIEQLRTKPDAGTFPQQDRGLES